jgi:hypothetical protein
VAVVFPGVLPRLWGLESAFGVGYSAAVPGLRWVGWAESATGKRRRRSGGGVGIQIEHRPMWHGAGSDTRCHDPEIGRIARGGSPALRAVEGPAAPPVSKGDGERKEKE